MDLRCRARPGAAEAEPAITYNHNQPDEHGPERLNEGHVCDPDSTDLSKYAGKSWNAGLPGEVFTEAFRVWQEGGESSIAAILGPMIDAALKGVA